MAAYDRPAQLGGPGRTVFVDETLLKAIVANTGQMQKRVIVMGFACEQQVLTGIIPNRSQTVIRACIDRFVAPGSRIVSDGHFSYRWLSAAGWSHTIVDHSIFWSDFKGNDLNHIETYWRVLKRTLQTYQSVGRKYLWLYLAEAEFRYNNRFAIKSNFEIMIERFPVVLGRHMARLQALYEWP